jgi:hypothetical protein
VKWFPDPIFQAGFYGSDDMATAEQFPKAPPLRFELTGEQVADVERANPPGMVALVVGYAQRHPWPEPERFTLCAWFVTMPEAEAALIAGGIMAKGCRKKRHPRKRKAGK